MKSLKLDKEEVVELRPKAPFSFNPTFHKPGHFPSQDTDWRKGTRWQTMLWQGERLGLKFQNAGTVKSPKINLHLFSNKKLPSDFISSLVKEINFRYDLQANLNEFTQKFKNDPQLGPIIKKWPGLRIMTPCSLYEYLMIMIVLQNTIVKRSVKMLQALFENFGLLLNYDGRKLWSFWRSSDLDKVTEQQLRDLKIGYRAKFIKRISEQFADNLVDEFKLRELPKDKQKEELLKLYGIGPASVNNLLWEVFKNYDALEQISPWEQKIYSKLFFGKDPENPVSEDRLLKYFDRRFGQYKMLAVHCIWEDLFWKRKHKDVPWLEKLIRL